MNRNQVSTANVIDEESEASTFRPARIIESLFKQNHAVERHLQAKFLNEREAYLRQLLEQGLRQSTLLTTAQLLLHVIRIMEFNEPRYIDKLELEEAARRWAQEQLAHRPAGRNKRAVQTFSSAGRGWFRFQGLYVTSRLEASCFDHLLTDFLAALHHEMGYRPETIIAMGPRMRRFLFWLSKRHDRISSINLRDIDEFMDEKRACGWRPRTIAGQCQDLRAFFRYAESRGLCRAGFSEAIKGPRVRQSDWEVVGPSWKEVRRLVNTMQDSSPGDCRAKAILLLGSVYGLRNTEITHLTLDDFDWQNEVFAVRRAKRGRLQQFPIQYEVGQAVIRYLQIVRPRCTCRHLFVTLTPPYRPLGSLAPTVRKQMLRAGVVSQSYGTHALRHTCATELLRKGTSLRSTRTSSGTAIFVL